MRIGNATLALAALLTAAAAPGCGASGGGAENDAGDGGDCSPFGAPGCAGNWYDCATGLCWQNPSTDETPEDQPAAKARCDALDESGQTDWRLPTIDELRGLIRGCDATALGGACGIADGSSAAELDGSCDGCGFRCGPGVDGLYLDPALADYDYYSREYWTKSIDVSGDAPIAWTINFEFGRVAPTPVDDVWLKSVRCVRTAGEGDGAAPDLPAGDCDSDCSWDEAQAAEAAIEGALAGADACFSGYIGAAPHDEPALSVYLRECWWGGLELCAGEPWWFADAAAAFASAATECLVTYWGYHRSQLGQANADLLEMKALMEEFACGTPSDDDYRISFDAAGVPLVESAPSVEWAGCAAAALEGHAYPCLAGLTVCGCYDSGE